MHRGSPGNEMKPIPGLEVGQKRYTSMTLKKQILVVEDNELNRGILREILSDEYCVLEAENGQKALDILQHSKDSISLILLDIMMPVMDGYAFLDRLKDDAELSLIPVIVTTQSGSESDEVTALTHGATDFVPKPYRPQVILHRVASLIKLRETSAMVNQFKYDWLTGLYSKEFFYQKVRERLLEDPQQDYCIVCSNIENFKLINDMFGAKEGDRLLQEVASITQNMVGDSGFCGRLGADHFLCLQKREQEQKDRQNFEYTMGQEISPLLKSVVMRWGIYEITDRSISVEQMCDRALLAANSIKGQYKHYFALYDDSLRSKLLREQAITDAMENALAEGQFVVYLQPKYSLKDERMVGAEALVRWIHPEWGFMSPGEFIPLFEKNGFIPRLDQYVWEQVCLLMRDWREKGYPLLPVSVNVSRADVYQSCLLDTLPAITKKYGINPSYLHLEITESAYAENPGQIISTVEELRKLGFIVEMDDFGSGYSSLNMLSQMTLDILKMDMKFVQNEVAKPAEQSILNDVISMAHRMHLSVVAEGVETREQVKRLMDVGCDYVQGYFFAKPMPPSEFEELLKTQRLHPKFPEPVVQRQEPKLYSLMVADEDAEYREKVCKLFGGEYEILEASDAHGAIDLVCKHRDISVMILSMTLQDNGADLVLRTLRQNPSFWNIPVLATIPNGEMMEELPLAMETDDFLCKCHPLADLYRRIRRMMEIADFRRRENALRDEASRDQLTGLLNRRGLKTAIASLRREELPMAVYLFDLDNLKAVNDTAGHNAGDRMIQSFADLLCRNTRHGDIICRYGGDEFLVVLKRLNDVDIVMRKGADICREFHEHFSDETLFASCSVGIALCESCEQKFEDVIEHADQALYCAKRENKGGYCLWEAQQMPVSDEAEIYKRENRR